MVPRIILLPIYVAELYSLAEVKKRQFFHNLVKNRWRSSIKPSDRAEEKNDKQCYEEYQDDIERYRVIPDIEQPTCFKVKPLNQQLAYDNLINSKIIFQSNSALEKGKVVVISMIPEGFIVGSCDENPKLNSIAHDFKFSDSQVKGFLYSLIDDNTLTRVDSDGFSLAFVESIVN